MANCDVTRLVVTKSERNAVFGMYGHISSSCARRSILFWLIEPRTNPSKLLSLRGSDKASLQSPGATRPSALRQEGFQQLRLGAAIARPSPPGQEGARCEPPGLEQTFKLQKSSPRCRSNKKNVEIEKATGSI